MFVFLLNRSLVCLAFKTKETAFQIIPLFENGLLYSFISLIFDNRILAKILKINL